MELAIALIVGADAALLVFLWWSRRTVPMYASVPCVTYHARREFAAAQLADLDEETARARAAYAERTWWLA